MPASQPALRKFKALWIQLIALPGSKAFSQLCTLNSGPVTDIVPGPSSGWNHRVMDRTFLSSRLRPGRHPTFVPFNHLAAVRCDTMDTIPLIHAAPHCHSHRHPRHPRA